MTPSWTMRVSWAMRSAMWQSTTALVPPIKTMSVANSWVACLVPLGGEQARKPVSHAVQGRPVLGGDSGQVHDLGSPRLSRPGTPLSWQIVMSRTPSDYAEALPAVPPHAPLPVPLSGALARSRVPDRILFLFARKERLAGFSEI
ncbi:hypothetical protein ACFT7S_01385 [Streptomyces sp. NPDC057136]|uniref:hypothetical protein n=1 Tax=Streptomyces sp. NPDC057136 TaxID=3346029 RepID=UPI00362C11B7